MKNVPLALYDSVWRRWQVHPDSAEGQPSFRAPKPGLSTASEAEFHFTTEFIQEWKLQLKPKKILWRQKRLFIAVETAHRNARRKNQEDKKWDRDDHCATFIILTLFWKIWGRRGWYHITEQYRVNSNISMKRMEQTRSSSIQKCCLPASYISLDICWAFPLLVALEVAPGGSGDQLCMFEASTERSFPLPLKSFPPPGLADLPFLGRNVSRSCFPCMKNSSEIPLSLCLKVSH